MLAERLDRVQVNAQAHSVHPTNIGLHARVPPFSKRLPKLKSLPVITRNHGHRDEQHEGGHNGDQGAHAQYCAPK